MGTIIDHLETIPEATERADALARIAPPRAQMIRELEVMGFGDATIPTDWREGMEDSELRQEMLAYAQQFAPAVC